MRNKRGREKFLRMMPTQGMVAEIGVAAGEHALLMKQISKPNRLYLIDPWVGKNNPNYAGSPAMQLITDAGVDILEEGEFDLTTHLDDVVAMKEYSVEASRKFPNEFFDYVYIDADHSYEAVKEAIKHWYPKIKMGGYIAGHDYRHGGKSKLAAGYGVVQAVHEFIDKNRLELGPASWGGNDWSVMRK